MKIDIIQRFSKYSFFINDEKEPFFRGRYRNPFFKKGYSELLSVEGEIVATVKIGNSPWFPAFNRKAKLTYILTFIKPYFQVEVTVQSYIKGFWTFDYKKDHYDFYRHRGHKRSLYKNGIQVARFDKRSVNLFENDRGYIISNNDEDVRLLICLFLAFDMGEYNEAEGTWDIGSLTEGKKEINPHWQPWK